MATYYWTGQALNANGSVYNAASGGGTAGGHTGNFWNWHGNWKQFVYGATAGGGSGGHDFHFVDPAANVFPKSGDDVIFAYLPDIEAIGLSGGPFPKAPCLFGGCYGDPETGLTWGGVTLPTNAGIAGNSADLGYFEVQTGYHQHLGAVSGDYKYSMGGEGTSSARYSGMRGYDSLKIRCDGMLINSADAELFWTHGGRSYHRIDRNRTTHGPCEVEASQIPSGFRSARSNITKLKNWKCDGTLAIEGNSYFEIEDSTLTKVDIERSWFLQQPGPSAADVGAENSCSWPYSLGITRTRGCTFNNTISMGVFGAFADQKLPPKVQLSHGLQH